MFDRTKLMTIALVSTLSLSASFALAGAESGGGNAVGNQLFDDAENSGSKVMDKAVIGGLVSPLLKPLEGKLPEMAADLRGAIKNLTWYLEPKPLSQTGACLNKSSVLVERAVVACQSKIQVRIDQAWFEANPGAQAPLILHELLVSRQLRLPGISDESIREISRQIRNPEIPAHELKNAVKEAGFGLYLTAFEKAHIGKLRARLLEMCPQGGSGFRAGALEESFSRTQRILDAYLAGAGLNEARQKSFRVEYPFCK